MKRLFTTFVCALMLVVSGAVSVFAVTFNVGNPIHLVPTDDTGNGHHDNDDGDTGRPKSPILTPVFYLDGYTLTASSYTVGSTVELLDEDDNVVFSTYIYIEGDIQLPTTLAGTYTIEVTRGSMTFIGEIEL